MALTLSGTEIDVLGKHRVAWMKATPAAADYPTGGYAISADQITGFGASATILEVDVSVSSASGAITTLPVMNYNATTGKLQAFVTGAAATDLLEEAASDFDLSAFVFALKVVAANA